MALSFLAICATSFCFILRALVVDDWGREFALSETQKGELLGVGLWPFAISIIVLSFIIDRLGFKVVFWFAGLCHIVGLVVLTLANGYWTLYIGTLIMALGNGAVEAAANPLIATVYPEDRPKWLNRLHAAWPGGMIAGGLFAMLLGGVDWQWKVTLMLLPVAAYVAILVGLRFPVSQRVASGTSYREMLGEVGYISALIVSALVSMEVGRVFGFPPALTIASIVCLTCLFAFFARSAGNPLYIIFVLLMMPLATTELSTDGWISSLMAPSMKSLGLEAGWVLIYASAVVFVVRIYAGSVIRRLTPLGTLAAASAFAAIGLYLLSNAAGAVVLFAALIYGIGKSFFWGTSLAYVSDRFPKGGALGINMMAGAGMLAAGVVGSSLLGAAQDYSTVQTLDRYDVAAQTTIATDYTTEKDGGVFGEYRTLDKEKVASASEGERQVIEQVQEQSKRSALKLVAVLPLFMLAAYLALMLTVGRRAVRVEARIEDGA
jgi:MFS family permease